jgi:signal transduction histidine kinase
VINTDAGKLRHILRNLIQNAIKFTPRGTVSVSADYLPRKREILFAVSDTGIGIPEAANERIFEKFAQGESSPNRRYEGAGLGLYIVKKFTELLGGTVSLKSEIEKGSCFTVTIPAEASPAGAGIRKPETHHSFRHPQNSAIVGY